MAASIALPNSGVDMPAGRTDCIPSGITGKDITYFTPDPLPVLIDRCREFNVPRREQRPSLSAMLLLRMVSRNLDGSSDFNQARRFLGLMRGRRVSCIEDFLEIGREISPKARELRNEIVFVGGRIPTSARHTYPPEDRLQGLMGSLEVALSSDKLRKLDPLIRSAIVGLFCSYTHPFLDGNGRWSRLMAFSTIRGVSDIWPSLVSVAFMNTYKRLLCNDIWVEARNQGLRKYLDLVVKFEGSLEESIDSLGLHEVVRDINRALCPDGSGTGEANHLLGGLFISGYLPTRALRSAFGLSIRAAEGRLRTAAGASEMMKFDEEALRVGGVLEVLDNRLEAIYNKLV